MSSLQNMPHNLLLYIAQRLDLADIYALQLTCRHLRHAFHTRPVYRELALGLLRRCRALPLYGFQLLSDLSTDQLVEVVKEEASDGIAESSDEKGCEIKSKSWYKVVGTPPGEEVDWLLRSRQATTFVRQRVARWFAGTCIEMLVSRNGTLENDGSCGSEDSRDVMNVFLLDPEARLLAGFVWISQSNSIGLYVLLDWDKEEYVFVNTGIQCITTRLTPARTINRNFIFPILPPDSYVHPFRQPIVHNIIYVGPGNQLQPIVSPQVEDPTPAMDVNNPPNPWSDQLWYPESAHFVRQWWPTVPSVPQLSCTVVLLAQHHPHTHVTKYVLAQHYFTVPLQAQDTATDLNDATMRMWYVSVPFEVVCVTDQADEDDNALDVSPRQRPLLAVDFGHAVWLEHVRGADDEEDEEPYERGQKRLRFVSFPSIRLEGEGHAVRSGIGGGGGPDGSFEMEGTVRTLAIPEELDLHEVETINIDQSQGAVILSVRQGKIFILCYE
ncbi:hypothetical protein BGY98DRAFT_931455 [Russula aff. rugulosa BPL654]|nr:hypothetical protein BGY98DRAFT_931455 [Russula aff. rugulosa BPL654]